jgi:hypothetical protein
LNEASDADSIDRVNANPKNNEKKSSVTFYLASTRPGNRNQEKIGKTKFGLWT